MYQKFEELLKKAGVTVAEVSRKTGISQTVFSNWKERNGKLSLDNAKKVADYFGVSIEYFLEEK